MLEFLLERANYWVVIVLMMIGLYITFASQNLIKRMVGLGLFQTTICLFYVTLGKVSGGTAPILFGDDAIEHHGAGHAAEAEGGHAALDAVLAAGGEHAERVAHLTNTYSNPLPHVLMLTAIVVGVATLSVGLALVVRIREAYGSIENDEVNEIDLETALAQHAEAEKAVSEATA
ncbi:MULTISPECIES: cation:proton antiporter subunit C [Hyphomonas]|jgi:multicomponent Na+:H+ antiporter subunit C|uniref:NADH-quinone oxidoreductase n=2 Tax=Hyphomonas adhaerens TaxID=81029 RepID=A0A3B9GVP4_9PROT|nr:MULTISPECIES: cation:proton antiporter subunit C [Hyphomonas]KCZ85792.1 putative NADH-quinone oxidoreductase [Hyphomonas adhaerens MHS-3]MBB40209.1 NADH-quinone oxidoreductase [Hyphomonas sp.]HAE26336.1 NADH-quinone oxidoreductase [Hyphomonas adhaerens]|tara:strand:- start:283 stop:807 length:525 start_codon:yes stop_codon:yes gene_type:complete